MKWPTFTNQEIKKVLSVIKSGNVTIGLVMKLRTSKKSFPIILEIN